MITASGCVAVAVTVVLAKSCATLAVYDQEPSSDGMNIGLRSTPLRCRKLNVASSDALRVITTVYGVVTMALPVPCITITAMMFSPVTRSTKLPSALAEASLTLTEKPATPPRHDGRSAVGGGIAIIMRRRCSGGGCE